MLSLLMAFEANKDKVGFASATSEVFITQIDRKNRPK